jgi:hypothetical protein
MEGSTASLKNNIAKGVSIKISFCEENKVSNAENDIP